jgi:hypothetical protein
MWRDEIVDRSWTVLAHLRELSNFILIGGWAVYFWTRKLKSRDIDLCINQDNFYKLQSELQKENVYVNRNPRLRKYEARLGDVEVDIYTPFQSNLIIPVTSLFERKWYTDIEGHDVALPEVLLLLKSQAAKARWASEKGVKDRVDLLALLLYSDWKPEFLMNFVEDFDPKRELLGVLARTVRESRVEYSYLEARYEREGRRLRDTVGKLLETRGRS